MRSLTSVFHSLFSSSSYFSQALETNILICFVSCVCVSHGCVHTNVDRNRRWTAFSLSKTAFSHWNESQTEESQVRCGALSLIVEHPANCAAVDPKSESSLFRRKNVRDPLSSGKRRKKPATTTGNSPRGRRRVHRGLRPTGCHYWPLGSDCLRCRLRIRERGVSRTTHQIDRAGCVQDNRRDGLRWRVDHLTSIIHLEAIHLTAEQRWGVRCETLTETWRTTALHERCGIGNASMRDFTNTDTVNQGERNKSEER